MTLKEINNGNLNKTFKFNFNNNDYIIRSSAFNNDFECKILRILEKNNLDVPRIKTNFTFENKYIMICDYIEGINPNIYNNLFFERLCIQLKELHNVVVDNDMINPNFENLEKLKVYYDASINSKYLCDELQFINNLFNNINQKLELNNLPKCIIHSDIKKENIVVNGNKVYLIDFGNCYIGNRFIDIIRLFMWFFIKNDNYDIEKMKLIIKKYFNSNKKITNIEKNNLEFLLKFCLLYNLLKDICLFEESFLTSEYIENNSLKWLNALKDEKKLEIVLGVLKNA